MRSALPDERRFGAALPGWVPPARPAAGVLMGRWVRLAPLAITDAADLHAAYATDPAIWDYLPYGPFDADGYAALVARMAGQGDPVFFSLTPLAAGRPAGVASLMRIAPEAGSIEVGHICLSPALQSGVAASEAIFLLADLVFALGYRRFEWKCDALNLPSRRAAGRFVFSFEGVFRQAAVVKGRNRDTAWFAMTDGDWPGLRSAWMAWLAAGNFGSDGQQRHRLSSLTAPHLVARDPAFI